MAQEKTTGKPAEIELLHANKFSVDKTTPKGASKLKGDVRLKHENALMFCDSAFLYDNNSLDAFGNVRIIEGDSLSLYGDSLFYNGNTQMAKVRGRVKIDDQASVLKTSFLDYNRITQIGHYYGGGEIDSKKEQVHLVSDVGYYYSESKKFHYKKNVVMTHPDYVIETDTMQYLPDAEKTWFFGPTTITSEDRIIYCEFGWFDQLSDEAVFIKNASILTKGQLLKGDTIEYDQANKIGISKCNVLLLDSNEKFEVTGDFARYEELDSTSFVTLNMLLKQDMDGDTFFLVADTLFSFPDTTGKRIIKTYHNTVFYKKDMQGACDSLMYHTSDSVIYMYKEPVLWSSGNQITADSIWMILHHGVVDKMYMNQNAFIIAKEESTLFNQIKGIRMVGHFKENELEKVDVYGAGETIYYPREEDSTLIGVNKTQCENMLIRIDSNQIKKITFYKTPVAKLTPTDEMPTGGLKLEGFKYRIDERPISEIDLIFKRKVKLAPNTMETIETTKPPALESKVEATEVPTADEEAPTKSVEKGRKIYPD